MKLEQLKEILNTGDFQKIRKVLTSQKKETDIEKLKKQWSVDDHAVCDTTKRQDRTVVYEDPETGDPQQRMEPVARIPVPFQKTIVSKAVSFLFGNPVSVTAQVVSEQEQSAMNAIVKILEDNKVDSRNREIARELLRSTEVAEIWYPVPKDRHEEYGFPTNMRMRLAVFSPWDGSSLYPCFDEFGDMIAFSREYIVKDIEGKDITHFDIYTSEEVSKWVKQSGSARSDWQLQDLKPNVIGKIPVVYASQEQAEWEDVQRAIERLETLLSNHADTNDYNGSPTVIAEGGIISMGRKGEQGKLLEIEKGGKVEYLSWDHAPESVKMEIENLLNFIRSFTQTPDISFESVKGLSSISGIALKLLFMDAHLKVMDKRKIFDSFLDRRINIIKAFLAKMDTRRAELFHSLNVYSEIKPYLISDDKERIDMLTSASGGKPAISQKTLIQEVGIASDPDKEYKQIQAEQERENTISITEPSI